MHNGELKIIPLQEFTSYDPPPLELDEALRHIRSSIRSDGNTATLFTDSKMNAAIQEKIKGFPRELQEQKHLARVMLPRLLAQVIHKTPQLIAPGVQSFYTRTTQFKVSPFRIRLICRNFANSNTLFLKIGSLSIFNFLVLYTP
jgi:hypothetical protein